MSALREVAGFQLHDIEASGDARDNPQWRELLGLDAVERKRSVARPAVREIVAEELDAILRGSLTGAALAEFNKKHPRGHGGKFGHGGGLASAVKAAASLSSDHQTIPWAASHGVDAKTVTRARDILRRPSTVPIRPVVTKSDKFVTPWAIAPNDADYGWLGRLYEKHPAVYNRLARERQVEHVWEQDAPRQFRGLSLDEAKADAAQRLRDAVADAPIVVRQQKESSLRSILSDGRIRTQFETGTSSGLLDTKARSDLEEFTFGLPPDVPATERPVYGVVNPGGIRAANSRQAVSDYGDIQIVLKPSVRHRTTVTVGDSLAPEGPSGREPAVSPSPIDAPDWRAAGPRRIANYADPRFEARSYIEAQVHGGVKADDIQEVVFARAPEPETADALARRGISWRVLASKATAKKTKGATRTIVAAELQRLAGHDVTPGHDELHHYYWTRDPRGLKRWVKSLHPFTTLTEQLILHAHVPEEVAHRWAAAWFHEVLGFWPGEKHVGAVRVPKAGRSALIQDVVAAELDTILRKFNPAEPRDPDGKWSLVGAAKKLLGKAQQADTPHVDEPNVQPPPKPHLPAHLVAARHDFSERVGRAAKEKDALAATPAKFSFHLKDDGSYRGTGQLSGVKGGGSAAALESYVSTEDYNDVNRRLRGMKREVKDLDGQPVEVDFTPEVEAHVDKLVADIDKTMKVSRLQDDVVVHRVVKDGSGLFGPAWSGINPSGSLQEQLKQIKEIQQLRRTGWRPDMTGMRFTDTGFVSTSAGEDWPKKWAKQADWERPSGATDEPVMLKILAPKGTGGIQLSEKGEMEILLERGLSFEVVEDHGVGSDGLRHLDLRVVEP